MSRGLNFRLFRSFSFGRLTCIISLSVLYFFTLGAWLSWLERTVHIREVRGSSPLAPTIFPLLEEEGVFLIPAWQVTRLLS